MVMLFSATVSAQLNDALQRVGETDEVATIARPDFAKIRATPTDEFLEKLPSYREQMNKYIDYKKSICSGEFSTSVLDDQGSTSSRVSTKRKLQAEERQLCLRELKTVQLNFIESMFVARKNYILSVQAKQLEELAKIKESAIQNLNKTTN